MSAVPCRSAENEGLVNRDSAGGQDCLTHALALLPSQQPPHSACLQEAGVSESQCVLLSRKRRLAEQKALNFLTNWQRALGSLK